MYKYEENNGRSDDGLSGNRSGNPDVVLVVLS